MPSLQNLRGFGSAEKDACLVGQSLLVRVKELDMLSYKQHRLVLNELSKLAECSYLYSVGSIRCRVKVH